MTMFSRSRQVLIFCFLTVASLAAQDAPVFRSSTDTVRVFVSVTSRGQGLVTGLAKDDFSVSDNGVPQPIRQFDNTPVPIRLVVLLDVSDSMVENVSPMREGVEHFLTKLHPDDLMKVGIFGAQRGQTRTGLYERRQRTETRAPQRGHQGARLAGVAIGH